MDEFIDDPASTSEARPGAARTLLIVAGGLFGLLTLGLAAAALFAGKQNEPPERIRSDPWLAEGRRLYLDRCLTCHGDQGRGDGPIARSIQGPPPGDLADDDWKHGDRPDQVLKVIRDGVADTAMPAWDGPFTPEQIRAVAAYIYSFSGRETPDQLRRSTPD